MRNDRTLLFTDHYQLVMAQVYFQAGLADRPAQFDFFYRSNPDYGSHQAGFCVLAGLGPLLEWMAGVRITAGDIASLRALRDDDGRPMFDTAFCAWLAEHGTFADMEVAGIAEGRVVHPHLPILSVTGPLLVAQLLETALLNHLNYPTLIATKAARIVQATGRAPVLEFGMRRGPGVAVAEGARAALVGGCLGTSNVQASIDLATSPRGTHAHSMVQAYVALGLGELEAFRAFARSSPDDCILLVDTLDTLGSGVPNAIRVFQELRSAGHEPVGVRLDSGDLAHLAVRTARMLDDAGFERTRIVLSGDLDELTIWQILTQISNEAPLEGLEPQEVIRRLVYGVGTRLITSEGDPALGGVYKLVGLGDGAGGWLPAVKISETPVKIPIPGAKQVWRLYDLKGRATADLVAAPGEDPLATDPVVAHHPHADDVSRAIARSGVSRAEALQVPLFSDGAPVHPAEPMELLRDRARADIDQLDPGVRRLINPHTYHVSLTTRMRDLQRDTVARARDGRHRPGPTPPSGTAGG